MRIDKNHIDQWADAFESKENFPTLISKLVNSTVSIGTFINIPCGSAVANPGWDGIVSADEQRSYIPSGTSLWEFGTDQSIKNKADGDYIKRTNAPLGYDPSECVFIFVTPRLWTKKNKWQEAKTAEKKWKEVRVYDAVDLAQWLNSSSAVARWFSSHVGLLPFEGVLTADQFWQEWSVGPRGALPPSAVTSGREIEIEKLSVFLTGDPGIKAVKAKTKTEAMAFIIATAKQFAPESHDRFFSKTLIVDTDGNYRSLHTNSARTPLNLIPKFEDPLPFYAAVSSGHHVIVPLGGGDTLNLDFITLPSIAKEGQVSALVAMGLNRIDAEAYSKESGRDINHLRRPLKFPHKNAIWSKEENLNAIVPALLLGRWNNNNLGDREILEQLSGISFEEYLGILNHWRDIEDSPLIQIGETWRLTSPLDLWHNLTGHITADDFRLLAESFLKVYQYEDDQNEDFDGTIQIVHSFSKPKKYSVWAKEGLVQSLILIGQYGEGLSLNQIPKPQEWVDSLISELLQEADGKKWISWDQKLPLLSEASPDAFLKAVSDSLEKSDPPIMKMFKGKKGMLGDSSNHTGLLWALEGLAWLPEYLPAATSNLLKLSEFDPGGNLINRPSNSLIEIYKPWHFQTLASFDERMQILETAVIENISEGWKLLLSLMPGTHNSASPTHKMRWRLFDRNTNIQYKQEELNDTYSHIIKLLLKLFDNSDQKLAKLIDISAKVTTYQDNKELLDFFDTNYGNIPKNSTMSWNKIRGILHNHRSYPDAYWSLSAEILDRYENLYNKLTPEDLILQNRWLFDSYHVDFPDGKFNEDQHELNYQLHFKRTKQHRTEALQKIKGSIGLEKTLDLADSPESSISIGETLAEILENEPEILKVLDILKKDDPNLTLVHRFVEAKAAKEGLSWVFEAFKKMSKENVSQHLLVNLFVPLQQTFEVWNYIAEEDNLLAQEYWSTVNPRFYHLSVDEKIVGMKNLLQSKRFVTAINTAYMIKKDLPTDLLVEILQLAGTEDSIDDQYFREHEVSSLFETLNEREDMTKEIIVRLEWLYLTILGSYGSSYKPKHLHQELALSPDFFIQILKWTYMPKDDKRKAEEQKELSAEDRQKFASQGYKLLNDFKSIPGTQPDNTIDKVQLNNWVDLVRDHAKAIDRIEMADMVIGKLLANYSEANKEYWPPDEISEVIERVNTKSIKNNFSMTVTNKRGFTSRSPFAGGEIERNNSKYFLNLANIHKKKHPNISEIFSKISKEYLIDAKHEDERAERDRLEY